MHTRQFRPGHERSLYAVFHSAVHGLASRNYTPEQIAAWAPENPDLVLWSKRMQRIGVCSEAWMAPVSYCPLRLL